MYPIIAYGCILAYVVASVSIVAARPDWASDANIFLRGFVNHEFLSLLGVILAITMASIASIHFEFNKIEEKKKKEFLIKSRRNLSSNAYWLVSLFCVGVAIVVIKPIAALEITSQAVFNLAALLIVLWHVLILLSLLQLVFAMKADISSSGGFDGVSNMNQRGNQSLPSTDEKDANRPAPKKI